MGSLSRAAGRNPEPQSRFFEAPGSVFTAFMSSRSES